MLLRTAGLLVKIISPATAKRISPPGCPGCHRAVLGARALHRFGTCLPQLLPLHLILTRLGAQRSIMLVNVPQSPIKDVYVPNNLTPANAKNQHDDA